MTRPSSGRTSVLGRSNLRLGAAALAVTAVALLVVGIVQLTNNGGGGSGGGGSGGAPSVSGSARRSSLRAALRAATPAASPFSGLTRTRVMVGSRTLDVLVADSESERETGLRRRRDLGPYGGMLFVFPSATDTRFTMSTVPVSLGIGFYDASGGVVDRLVMRPCSGTDATCPAYRSGGTFSYALETLAGRLPRGALAGSPHSG